MYASQSQSLAALELLVHLHASHLLLSFSMIPVDFHAAPVEAVELADLPAGWKSNPPPSALQRLGDRWVAEQRSVVLQVPSAIVPDELNFLLIPRHRDFGRVAIGPPEPLQFDRRLR